jgi:hypothetical protein
MNLPIANRSPGLITFSAVTMGSLAMLRAWLVLYPSRHTGFTGSPLLIGFEAMKAAVLLLVLCRVYMLNRYEDDQAVRSTHELGFTRAAAISVVVDTGITLWRVWYGPYF